MPVEEQTSVSCDVSIDKFVDLIVNTNAVFNATVASSQSSTRRIPRVRGIAKNEDDYEKYYVPKVVSIGPYHYGKAKLQLVEKLKPVFAMKLFENDKETLRSVFKKLCEPEMVQDLRSFYEQDSTTRFSDMEFTNMMLLDSCFILFYTRFIYFNDPEEFPELKNSQIVLAHQDLFLLENQIPFKVLMEVAQLMKIGLGYWLTKFISESSIVIIPWWPKRKRSFASKLFIRYCFGLLNIRRVRGVPLEESMLKACDHLLHFLHHIHTEEAKAHGEHLPIHYRNVERCNYRNVSELVGVGIHFKPSVSMSLSSVEFSKGWLGFSADVKLPPIYVNDSTKTMLLNMIAYETCLGSINDAWVTSYIYLLDSLIDHAEDVKILRKSWVLETSLGSDEEVAKLFNEIGIDLVPNKNAYWITKDKIQRHYESWTNTVFSQLKNEYFKSPWTFLALLGALIALFLSSIQTYFTAWSPKGECDDLCTLLKKNHHL